MTDQDPDARIPDPETATTWIQLGPAGRSWIRWAGLGPAARSISSAAQVTFERQGSVVESGPTATAYPARPEMGELTGGYATPADGCATYRTTMDALAAVERDLHEHIHKENNILFPRAQALVAARG